VQLGTQIPFELPDLMEHRRWREMQPFASPSEVGEVFTVD
jgi:hypothetical protein